MEAHAALVRTPGAVVLDPVAGEHRQVPVVAADGDLHPQLAVGVGEHGDRRVAEPGDVRGTTEEPVDGLERRHVLGGALRDVGALLGVGHLGSAVVATGRTRPCHTAPGDPTTCDRSAATDRTATSRRWWSRREPSSSGPTSRWQRTAQVVR